MSKSIISVLEHPIQGIPGTEGEGRALARILEAHPALSMLLDYVSVDPIQIALDVGMVSPSEEDGVDDLGEIDFGPQEWFEPAAGLATVRQALRAVREDPESIAAALYDPGLRPEDVMADLEALEQTLVLAQQHETRFHLTMKTGR